ncbi:MAG: hypothetical protein AAF587_02415 [Bacteroidota bacterium]
MRILILFIVLFVEVFPLFGQSLTYRSMPANPEYLMWHRARTISTTSPPDQVSSDSPPSHSAPKPTGMILGLGLTGTSYYGDLNHLADAAGHPPSHVAFHPGVNISFRKTTARRIIPVLHVGYGKFVSQNDALLPAPFRLGETDTLLLPNSYAETVLIYGQIQLRLAILPLTYKFQPYVSVGVGGLMFAPRAEDGILLYRKKTTRSPDETEYGTLTYSFPFSAGFEYFLSHRIGLHLAYSYRINGSDYLDNISQLGNHKGNDRLHQIELGILVPVQ